MTLSKNARQELEIDLQFFADPAGGNSEPTDPAGTNPGANNDQTPPANQESADTQEGQDKDLAPQKDEPKPEKTLTQSEVNKLIAKEAKKAQEKLLKQLGVEDFNSAKDGLAKFKEWQDSQKTEAEKQAERLQQLEADLNSVNQENENLKAQLSAVRAGVDAEYVEDVIVLAQRYVTEDVTIDDAIGKVIEKYPHFKGEQEEPKPNDPPAPKFSSGQHQKQTETEIDQWLNAFK